MNTLLEDPTPIIVFGILAEAILAVILVQTRRGVLLWPIAGVLAAVAIGVIVERLVVTERERVEATIYACARALEQNDARGVAACLSRSATDILRRAVYYIDRLEFGGVSLRGMEIEINDLTSPPTAEATFHVSVQYSDRRGEWGWGPYVADCVVGLVLEDGQWKVRSYEDNNLSPLVRDIR